MTYATPRLQTLTGARRRFEDALARCRRMYESGETDMRWATANGHAALLVPDGYTRSDTASYVLGALHQRRDTVHMRGASGGLTTMGSPGRKRRTALRDGTPDDA